MDSNARTPSLEALYDLMLTTFNLPHPATPKIYTYRPIPPSTSVIRLLHLLPGTPTSPLSGHLEFSHLASPPPYVALSYCWGGTITSSSPNLNLQGTPSSSASSILPITPNLRLALLRLRSRSRTRTFWIDAVCINQSNLEEKAQQVQLMGHIYRSAERTVCWLGEEEAGKERGKRAFELLKKIGGVSFRGEKKGWVDEGMEGRVFGGGPGQLPARFDPGWGDILWLYNLPWFHRLWVVQEFALGQRVRFMCGATVVDWRDIDRGNTKLGEHGVLQWALDTAVERNVKGRLSTAEQASTTLHNMGNLKKLASPAYRFYELADRLAAGDATLEDLEREYERARNPALSMFTGLQGAISDLPNRRELTVTLLCSLRRTTDEEASRPTAFKRKHSFTTVLSLLCHMGTTDPRDKLFALMSLVAEGRDVALRPSYTESVASVYTRFARHLITNGTRHDGLVVLLRAGLCTIPPGASLSLPSWVRDESTKSIRQHDMLLKAARMGLYNTACDRPPKVLGSPTIDSIHLATGTVDVVANVRALPDWQAWEDECEIEWVLDKEGNIDFYDDENERRIIAYENLHREDGVNRVFDLRQYFAAADELFLRQEDPPLRKPQGEAAEEALWRTLIANVSSTNGVGLADPSFHNEYVYFRRRLEEFGDTDEPTFWTHSDHSFGHWFDTFRSTAEGYAMCGTKSRFVGLVPRCTISGDEIHVIVGARTPVVLRPTGNSDNTYQLVGPCYIHGIMQGEALRDPNWSEGSVIIV